MEKRSLMSHLAPGLQGKLPGRLLSPLILQGALPNGNPTKTLKEPKWTTPLMKKRKTRRKRDVELYPETQLLDRSLQKNRKE
ncbi:DNA methyltransferase 1 [Rhinolophus ferrumequinum]|uniref:DNA methyltransferase 1 n=1 Tax=Rhinolophus ferrumequinum TaxID=59479 RepID=A0A7J7TZR2_RHIFE|nr:DNA methyltransferase 1 [Rhinolophus ferrumequinum]